MMYGGNFRYLQLSTFLQYYFVRSVVSGQRNEMAENREKHVIEICAFCCCGSKQISLFYLLLILFICFLFFCFSFLCCCSRCSVRADRPMAELIGVNSNYISLEIKQKSCLDFALLTRYYSFVFVFVILLEYRYRSRL